jgi:hypothetical protein
MSDSRPQKPKEPPPPKVADRPHRLTLAVAWTGVVFSLVSLALAGWSLNETRRNNRITHEPYVKATVQFPETIREQLRVVPREAVVRIPMLARILNHGNTAVDDITLEYRITLNGRAIRDIREKLTVTNRNTGESPAVSIDPGDEMTFPMSVEMPAGTFLDALKGITENLFVCTQVSYRDIYGVQAGKINCRRVQDEPPVMIVK